MTGALAVYEAHAEELRARYDGVPADAVFAPIADLLPAPPTPVLDAGAGSGRDAAWLAARGHPVTAAEPVAEFRAAIAARAPAAAVIAARLPDLVSVDGAFGLILVNAVWHHLDGAERDAALPRLRQLLAPEGRLAISLRQAPGIEGQPVHAADPAEELARAEAPGFALLARREAPPRPDAPGISWTWLVLEAAR